MKFVLMITFVSQLLHGLWAIAPDYAKAQLPLMAAIVQADKDAVELYTIDTEEEAKPVSAVIGKNGLLSLHTGSFNEAPENSTAIITLDGIVVQDDEFFQVGTATLDRILKEADAHPNITSIVYRFKTPGGMIAGTLNHAETIRNVSKPIVGFADELTASAGYWLISATDEIMVSSKSAFLGSIGTMATFADFKPFFKELGIVIHEVYATKSTEKNKPIRALEDGNEKPMQQIALDPLNELFHTTIRNNRPGVNKEVFKGGIFLGEQAIDLGLADSFGTLDDAVARAQDMAEKGTKPNRKNNNATVKINWK